MTESLSFSKTSGRMKPQRYPYTLESLQRWATWQRQEMARQKLRDFLYPEADNSQMRNSEPFSVRLAGPKPYGMTLPGWLSVSPGEVRAPSGTAAEVLGSFSSTVPPGSATPAKTPSNGPTPWSTRGRPTPPTTTTSLVATNRGGSGHVSPSVCHGPAAWLCTVGYGHEVCRIAAELEEEVLEL